MNFTTREYCAILAGLRLLQETEELTADIEAIATNAGSLSCLTDEEIDDLSDRINSSS